MFVLIMIYYQLLIRYQNTIILRPYILSLFIILFITLVKYLCKVHQTLQSTNITKPDWQRLNTLNKKSNICTAWY